MNAHPQTWISAATGIWRQRLWSERPAARAARRARRAQPSLTPLEGRNSTSSLVPRIAPGHPPAQVRALVPRAHLRDRVAVAPASDTVHAKASWTRCPDGYVALFEHNNYEGRMVIFRSRQVTQALSTYDFNDETSSWVNRTGHTVMLYEHYEDGHGRGRSLRLENGARSSSMDGSWNDEASAIRIL